MPLLTLPRPRQRAKNIYDLLPRRQEEPGRFFLSNPWNPGLQNFCLQNIRLTYKSVFFQACYQPALEGAGEKAGQTDGKVHLRWGLGAWRGSRESSGSGTWFGVFSNFIEKWLTYVTVWVYRVQHDNLTTQITVLVSLMQLAGYV